MLLSPPARRAPRRSRRRVALGCERHAHHHPLGVGHPRASAPALLVLVAAARRPPPWRGRAARPRWRPRGARAAGAPPGCPRGRSRGARARPSRAGRSCPARSRSWRSSGRQVDDHDLVGAVEEAVGHPLAHVDVGLAQHQVVQALEVLDVERADHADARVEQLLDVLVALLVAAAGHVGVGQLVDQHEVGLPGEDGVEVHLLERHAAVHHRLARDDLEPGDLGERLLAPVRLDDAADDVDPLGPRAAWPRAASPPSCPRPAAMPRYTLRRPQPRVLRKWRKSSVTGAPPLHARQAHLPRRLTAMGPRRRWARRRQARGGEARYKPRPCPSRPSARSGSPPSAAARARPSCSATASAPRETTSSRSPAPWTPAPACAGSSPRPPSSSNGAGGRGGDRHLRMQALMLRGQRKVLAAETPEGVAPARAALEATIAELEASHGVRREALVIGGFSQGAMVTTENRAPRAEALRRPRRALRHANLGGPLDRGGRDDGALPARAPDPRAQRPSPALRGGGGAPRISWSRPGPTWTGSRTAGSTRSRRPCSAGWGRSRRSGSGPADLARAEGGRLG